MKFLYQLFFVAAFGCALSLNIGSDVIAHDSDSGLLSYMARSNELFRQNPARSLECFNYYIPLINELAKNYEIGLQACLNASLASRAEADAETLEQRQALSDAAKNSCDLLSRCGDDESVEGIFQCYIDGGAANAKTMYLINSNATQELAELREQYYLIDTQEFRCTNTTKRAYEKESSEAYANLNSCILGNSPVPTQAPPTTPPVPTQAPSTTTPKLETTTEEPETTTEEPETTTDPWQYSS